MKRKLALAVLASALAANAFALPLLQCHAPSPATPSHKVVATPLLSSNLQSIAAGACSA